MKTRVTHTRRPEEKITLAECQALLSAGIEQGITPARVGAKWALIAACVAALLAVVALVAAVVR